MEPATLLLLPSFGGVAEVISVLPRKVIELEQYSSDNFDELLQQASTAYLSEGTLLAKGMSLMFDYGIRREGNGIILEVV